MVFLEIVKICTDVLRTRESICKTTRTDSRALVATRISWRLCVCAVCMRYVYVLRTVTFHNNCVSMMSSNKVIAKLKRVLNEDLSADLEEIIIGTAFDSEAAILGINRDIILEIESFVNENKYILANTSYRNCIVENRNFKLKPGHKSVLLSLPGKLRDFNKKKESGKENVKKSKKPNNQLEENINFHNERVEVTENEEKSLKEKLLQKIQNFASKLSISNIAKFDESCIQEYHRQIQKVKCKVQCPFCEISIGCEHSSYWRISNLERHLKKHINVVYVENETATNLSSEIISFSVNQDSDLEAALSD